MKREKELKAKTEFDASYELYGESIFNFCMSRLSCDVEASEDCTQEVFLVYYKRLLKGESFEYPRAFLYKTAVNMIKRTRLKQEKQRVNETELDDRLNLSDSGFGVESEISYEQIVSRINAMLNENELQLFTMFFIENIKVKDISEKLGITPGTCSTRLSRLRDKVKNGIKDLI